MNSEDQQSNSRASLFYLNNHKKSMKMLKRSKSKSSKGYLNRQKSKENSNVPFSKTYIVKKMFSSIENSGSASSLRSVQMTKSYNVTEKEKNFKQLQNSQIENYHNIKFGKDSKNTTLKNSICITGKQLFNSSSLNKCKQCVQYQHVIACLQDKNLKLCEENTNLRYENLERFKQYINKSKAFEQMSNIHKSSEMHVQKINKQYQQLRYLHEQLLKKYKDIHEKLRKIQQNRGKQNQFHLNTSKRQNLYTSHSQIGQKLPLSQIKENYLQNKIFVSNSSNGKKNDMKHFMNLMKQLLQRYNEIEISNLNHLLANQEIEDLSLLQLTPQNSEPQINSI